MAERRMFAKSITNSARFLQMSADARLLYYDLGMNADDDGVVEAFTVLRTTGADKSLLDALAGRGFVAVLNDDLVTYITDWKQNNFIRPDRYKSSMYTDLLKQFNDGIPTVDQRYTQVRLGKDRLGKESIGKESVVLGEDKPSGFIPPTVEEVQEYCLTRNNNVDPERFIDYYKAKGWMVGQNKMEDWKATVRSWERNENNKNKGGYNDGRTKEDSFGHGTIYGKEIVL